jgi:SWI/SNF-related matrix-associated actin-dependent regulator 1 of chromatin subfamily A
MGLGKTYQALSFLALHPEMRPAVIVCPASLKYNWQREAWQHARLDAEVLDGTRPVHTPGNLWIINYDIMQYWVPWLITQKPVLAILDEFQKIKNRAAKRTVACTHLGQAAEAVMGLSGTPILSKPVEFYPILHLVAPQVFPSFHKYAFTYCDPKRGFKNHWDFNGASNIPQLRGLLAPIMLRRLKEDVLPELPRKARTVIPVRIDNAKEYAKAENEFIEWLAEAKGTEAAKRARGAEALVKLGALKRLAAEGKRKAVLEWLMDWREATGQKIVVFAVHRSITEWLHKALPGSVLINGDTNNRARQEAVDKFQRDGDKCPWFVGNLEAAGVGLTLTAASTTAFVEIGWVPTAHEQAEDRVLRIGQKAASVNAYYFVGRGTVEERVMRVLEAKADVVGQVLDGVARVVQTTVMQELLQSRGKGKGQTRKAG